MKKEKKHKKDKKHKKHKKQKKEKGGEEKSGGATGGHGPEAEPDSDQKKESESEVEDSLDDLEKHLREKALRSMRKAQMSPSSQSWGHLSCTPHFPFSLPLSAF